MIEWEMVNGDPWSFLYHFGPDLDATTNGESRHERQYRNDRVEMSRPGER